MSFCSDTVMLLLRHAAVDATNDCRAGADGGWYCPYANHAVIALDL